MKHEVALPGCTPVPLAGYLKALGVLRLVAEQADAGAKGCWRNDHFILASELDADALHAFFLDKYRPTPVVAPWNGGSGFYYREEKLDTVDPVTGKREKTGRRNQPTAATRTLDTLLSSTADRFSLYREVVQVAKTVLTSLDFEEAPKDEPKDYLVSVLRSTIPESGLVAFDSTLFLTQDGTKYPPLWGTGGTDGNLDFTNNFMQRLVGLFDATSGDPTPEAKAFLSEALFAVPVPGLLSTAIGQFSPGSAGGANQASGFSSDSLINPWDFVLMLEGALLFAAAATRRLESRAPGALSYPFTVRPTGAGSGSSALGDEGNARAEMWSPLGSAATPPAELKPLRAEGRVTAGRQPARDGPGSVRAIS
jgi:CRISPR-associated protein Csx17